MTKIKIADILRHTVVDFLKLNADDLLQVGTDLPFLLDKNIGKSYLSLEHRFQAMTKKDEYGGFWEIVALSYLGNVCVQIYCNKVKEGSTNSSNDHYTLFAQFIPFTADNSVVRKKSIKLLYYMDTKKTPGHFSLLVTTVDEQCSQLYTITEEKMDVTFCEFLLNLTSSSSSHALPQSNPTTACKSASVNKKILKIIMMVNL